MIVNQEDLLELSPIKNMLSSKHKGHGVSHGLGEAGYDLRIKQDIVFRDGRVYVNDVGKDGRFTLASAIEEFTMPDTLVGVVHDKSTWARQALSVFNTVIEPGFHGGLTLELVYHGSVPLRIPAGAGIAQVIFHRVTVPAAYNGKYQDQSSDPVQAIFV